MYAWDVRICEHLRTIRNGIFTPPLPVTACLCFFRGGNWGSETESKMYPCTLSAQHWNRTQVSGPCKSASSHTWHRKTYIGGKSLSQAYGSLTLALPGRWVFYRLVLQQPCPLSVSLLDTPSVILFIHLRVFFFFLSWRDGSTIKNTGCFSRGPKFSLDGYIFTYIHIYSNIYIHYIFTHLYIHMVACNHL